ncbi:hypothetical protein C2845_PM13G14710 [Panicum miliaceum]|uniref:Protein NRT1/ PTR FAMILY 5.10-like n=1 Tax=Panicum miliaceum TaxID=4540 RepID=A0A3L6RNW1_PANMI|nr:hypothetical protein C2845_PM13G14710 [Panicum miliaceum]
MRDRSELLSLALIQPAMAETVAGATDYRGQPASRAATGGWKSSVFVMAMEIAERFAYKGVAANLITYLTGPLGQPMARAAASIDAWKGVSQMLPLPLAMGALSVSSAFPVFRAGHVAIFYVALYLVALGEGAHKPCAQAFAADQFDEKVDNVGWGLGFGIPCIVIAASLAVFLLGSRSYRYYTTTEASPFSRVGKAFLALIESWTPNRRVIISKEDGNAAAVEEVKSVLRLLPIWASCIIYAIIFSQTSTFFTKQAATLDRRIGAKFKVPPAALQTFISVSIVVFIPVYDRLFVPLARRCTGRPTGITMLQRIGAGLALSLVAVALSALVEMKRLGVARDAGLVNTPKAQLPMSLWWMVPQYVLIGVADVFAMIGLQEFFYDQVPDAARGLGLALFLSIFGVGHLLSSLLISVIDKATAKSGTSWFSNNLNRAHLDYFYWLLTGLCAVELVAFVLFSRVYVYKRKGGNDNVGHGDFV